MQNKNQGVMGPTSGLHGMVSMACDRNGVVTSVNENGPFTCLSCGSKMVFRHTHKRTRCTNGVESTFEVRGHFYHVTTTTCGESWMHVAAKRLLMERPGHPLLSRCGGCKRQQAFDALPHGHRVLEYRAGDRVIDIAILSVEDGAPIGALEVRHTHACDDAKLLDLYELLGNRWCEVLAVDVVQCILHGVPIPVATHMHELCNACHQLFLNGVSSTQTVLLQTREMVDKLRKQTDALEAAAKERLAVERQHRAQKKLTHLLSLGGIHVLDFGKYRGVSLEAVMTEDPAYVAWVAKGGGGDINVLIPSRLVLAARTILRGHCHVCGVTHDGPAWKTLCKECWLMKQ